MGDRTACMEWKDRRKKKFHLLLTFLTRHIPFRHTRDFCTFFLFLDDDAGSSWLLWWLMTQWIILWWGWILSESYFYSAKIVFFMVRVYNMRVILRLAGCPSFDFFEVKWNSCHLHIIALRLRYVEFLMMKVTDCVPH